MANPSLISSSPSDAKAPPTWLQPLVMLLPAGLWLAFLLVIPTLLIFQLSLVPGIRPGQVVNPSGLDNYLHIFLSSPTGVDLFRQGLSAAAAGDFNQAIALFNKVIEQADYLRVLLRSLAFSIGTTVFCLVLGFPVAYWIALKVSKRWQNLLLLSFVLPLWTSSLLRSYAWITILRPTGVLNTVLNSLGIPSLDILNREPAVLIGMTYSLLPYMVLILYAALEKLDRRLLEAAADLGATPRQSFWRVTVPQSFTGIAAGSLLVFITSMGDFVNPELLGGASSMTMARLIYNQFLGVTQNWGFGSALSMVLILFVSIGIALLLKYGDRSVAGGV